MKWTKVGVLLNFDPLNLFRNWDVGPRISAIGMDTTHSPYFTDLLTTLCYSHHHHILNRRSCSQVHDDFNP